ncbi:hypothetical protein CHS0354_022394 [Potamilus streckersoni]|uniref:RFX-type winged-helix domain-containing protein n=1 Tax=Potamilus streckersoni TaxID=2493646 RepID=A0AAE0SX51_9BIVA|nr:hypothetical protein CHS0354_022394 [Potamilus streckersoni]
MATQTYVTDLQAMNPATVLQVHHVNQNSSKSQASSQANQKSTGGSQQYIVTTTVAETDQNQGQETVTLQQGGQTLYPAHVQMSSDSTQFFVTKSHAGPQPRQTQVQVQKSQSASTGSQQQQQQQYVITTTEAETEQNQAQETVTLQQGGQTLYPAHVQQTYQTDYGQTTLYTPVTGTYYQTTGGAQVTGTGIANLGTIQTVQGHILTQQSGTYLIQGGTMDGEGTPLTYTTRASPATVSSSSREVQWLIDNYETADGVSLPRSTLYNHYLRHCQEQNLDPMNPASFGKLIRSVFLGLKTRRLGTRGNSKYHYYGIRIKANSPLNQFTDDQTMAMRQQPMYQGKNRFRPAKQEYEGSEGSHGTQNSGTYEGPTSQQQKHQQFLGDASTAIPNFGDVVITGDFPDGVTVEHIRTFEKMYREHAEAVVDVVVNLQFSLIEALWQGFWRNQSLDHMADNDYEKRLPRDILFAMCKYEPIQKYVRKSDYAFYQALVEVLIPDVLRPIPSSLTQAIRNFAKSLENWLKGAMTGVPEEMVKTKLGAVSAFAQTLRRYTSLNHLAQAARAVLQNTSQINQMLTDLNRVDFANVQEQASWVCQCEDGMVQQLEQDFKRTLQQQNSLEQWAIWLEGVVNQVLKPHEGSSNFPKAARQFLLKWSFYSSMVIRDLTLRSAASFGSFHLIRLLYDEYMFYLVEHKVAAATGETPIAVMGEVRQFIDLSSAVALGTLESDSKPMHVGNKVSGSSTASSVVTKVNESTGSGTTTLMVLTPSSNSSTATHNGTVSVVTAAPGSNAATLTVKTATTSGNLVGAKTIVVMPMSSALASGGDTHISKRLKIE